MTSVIKRIKPAMPPRNHPAPVAFREAIGRGEIQCAKETQLAAKSYTTTIEEMINSECGELLRELGRCGTRHIPAALLGAQRAELESVT
jgi:hypothetical protein